MAIPLSEGAKNLFQRAIEICEKLGHYYLGTEHLLLALLEEKSDKIKAFFNDFNKTEDEIRIAIAEEIDWGDSHLWKGTIYTPRVKKIATLCEKEAKRLGANEVEPLHIFAAIFIEGKGVAVRALEHAGISLEKARKWFSIEDFDKEQKEPKEQKEQKEPKDEAGIEKEKKDLPKEEKKKKRQTKTPILDKLGRDLTEMAEQGKLDPVLGRSEEIQRTIQILTRKTKNNPILIGEAGVGKTAVVYGLAQYMNENSEEPSNPLANKRIIEISVASLVAGTRHRGEFEERMQQIMEEVRNDPDVIIFIDEIHSIIGAGDGKGALDAGNIIKPALSRAEMSCIGATTDSEYNKYIESDPALERRFQPVLINEPSEEECFQILSGLRNKFEKHHNVKISDKALRMAIELSIRYLPDRHLPDKAIDLIDEAASKVRIKQTPWVLGKDMEKDGEKAVRSKEVNSEIIAEVISSWTGVPVHQLTKEEGQRLQEMESILKSRVIGQNEAVKKVAQTIKVARMGLENPKRPKGIFLFLGPTGVGKTELAKTLAEFLFGTDRALIRIDMSEFMEKHNIARLIGAPPGYVGYDQEGQLTKAVRKTPYSVVLLDEIEKAHPEVFDLFLQVFDDGRLTDGKGRVINFTNSIIIMTSNLGSAYQEEKGLTEVEETTRVQEALRSAFRPEFINRIDEIIIFKHLSTENLKFIALMNLEELLERLKQKQIELTLEDDAMNYLLKHGYNPSFGARPLKRAIQTLIAKPIAEQIIAEDVKPGDKLKAKVQDDKIVFTKITAENKEPKESSGDTLWM